MNETWREFGPKRVILGHVEHEVKVTHLGKGIYGCRVFVNGELNQEYRCKGKENIGKACREALRWEDKCGNWSDFASRARCRQWEKKN